MFGNLESILSVALGLLTALSAITGWIVSHIKNGKNKKLAKAAEAANEITELAAEKVAEVEKMFLQAANVLKAVGVKTGEIKKESVMMFIERQCAEKNIEFNFEYWSKRVEKLVSVLNANKR